MLNQTEIKNIGELIKSTQVECGCGYSFNPEKEHYQNCIHCMMNWLICPRCKKVIKEEK